MIAKGTYLKVKTKTKDDVFGECIYEVVETGLPCRICKGDDGMKCVMLGGSGPSARPGYPVPDCDKVVIGNIAKGVTEVMPERQAKAFAEAAGKKASNPRRLGSGVIEF